MARVPARYVGAYAVNLRQIDGPHYDANGRLIRDNVLRPGDTMMVEAQEAFGQTLKWDPTGREDPLYLGVGRVVMPEHAGLPENQLRQLGYEFQPGSSNWQPLVAPINGPVPGDEATAPLGSDNAREALEALVNLSAKEPATVTAPDAAAQLSPEELAFRKFRRNPRTPAQRAQRAAIDAQEQAAPAAPASEETPPADGEE